MEHRTKILVIEDHDIVVWALTKIVETNFPDTILYTATDFNRGLRITEEHHIDLVVMDIDLSGGNSTKMISDLRNIQPLVPILIYSGLTDEENSLEYLTAGANGFLSKKAPMSTVADVMRLVLNGGRYMSTSLQDAITEKYLRNSSSHAWSRRKYYLTVREKEVVLLLLQGKWTKEIADQLGMKLTTVSTHKKNIFEKFEVDNSIELLLKIQKEMPEMLKKDW
jgi:two-component system invasion response regulator UvrY